HRHNVQGYFKDAVLDLVYIFGFHLRLGSSDRAADLGLRTLGELDRRDVPRNEQCRSVLAQLIEAARGQCLDEGILRSAREYLRVQGRRSLPAAPMPAGSGERVPSSPTRPAIPQDPTLVEPLLAKALWARLRRETRREQRARVARSPEYHTTTFVEL